jgi:hypothetical protein
LIDYTQDYYEIKEVEERVAVLEGAVECLLKMMLIMFDKGDKYED